MRGTVVQYDNGAVLTFTGSSGFRCTYTDQAGETREKLAGFADDAALLSAGLDALWPLSLGAEKTMFVAATSVSSGGFGGSAERFTVLTRETVSVPAGKFDTVVVEQEETTGGQSGHDFKRTFWYAPDLGVIVKSTFVSMREARFAASIPARMLPGDYMAVRIVGAATDLPATAAQPAPAAPPAVLSVDAIANRLHTIKDLLDRRLITAEEYKAKRKAILDSIQPVP